MVSSSKGATRGRARRTRSPHPGVVLKAPIPPRTAWRARYTDPDSRKEAYESLDPLGAGRNAQTRKLWAQAKAKGIAKRRDELALGAPRATGTGLDAALDRYYLDHPRLRPLTLKTYKKATVKLAAWCADKGIRSADQFTLAELVAFRAYLGAAPKSGAKKEGTRGAKLMSDAPRSASTANVEVRSVKVVLNYLRRAGRLPRCSRDDITDGLKVFDTGREAPAFLRQPEIKALLDACRAHDQETFKATREEHAEGLEGRTPRYPAITPLVTVALLTGMRFSELSELDWSEVDLSEGEIRLGTRTKTKHARTIPFEHSILLGEVFRSLHSEGAEGRVWAMTKEQIRAASKRLTRFGAPKGWSFQSLRRTCGTFLTNAPGIFGGSSAYRSARILGHSVQVAERHYLGVVKIDKEATTLEAAMGIT